MVFSTHRKATVAQTKVMAELSKRDFDIFLPIGDHLPFDLIAYKDGNFYRIQSKYTSKGFLNKNTYWYSKNTVSKKHYKLDDFDYYGAYLPDIDQVIFPSSKFAGCTISFKINKSPTPFYWYEDFLDFTQSAIKKSYLDFNLQSIDVTNDKLKKYNSAPRPQTRKVIRPSKDELKKLVWEMPTSKLAKIFGVSDNAISKWCKNYDIVKPGRGYWTNK